MPKDEKQTIQEATQTDEQVNNDLEQERTEGATDKTSEPTRVQEPSFDEFLKNPKNQSEFDKRISKAINTAIEKRERLNKMSEEERENERLSEREKELEERIAQQELKELIVDVKEELSEKGLPVVFAELIASGTDREDVDLVIKGIKSTWDAEIAEAVKVLARQKTPKAGYDPLTEERANPGKSLGEFARTIRKVK